MKISDRAVLVRLRQSQWSGRKYDRQISEELAKLKGADSDAVRANKLIVPEKYIAPVRTAHSRLYNYHRDSTMPWLDNGERVLVNSLYFEYTQRTADLEQDIITAQEKFFSVYPQLVQSAPQRMNGLFKSSDYPTVDELRQKYSVGISFVPIPEDDIRMDGLSPEELDRINSTKEQEIERAIRGTVSDLAFRIMECVKTMSENLRRYERDSDGKVLRTFRDSTVENLRTLVEQVKVMNFTGDKQLSTIIGELEDDLCVWDGESLRQYDELRNGVAETADDIFNRMMQVYGDQGGQA